MDREWEGLRYLMPTRNKILAFDMNAYIQADEQSYLVCSLADDITV